MGGVEVAEPERPERRWGVRALRPEQEVERHDLGNRDEQAERRHELGDGRRGAQVPEEEALEDQPQQRCRDDDRDQEGRQHPPPVGPTQRIEERGRRERLRGERQVEDAGRLVCEHDADRDQAEHAAEGDAVDDVADERACSDHHVTGVARLAVVTSPCLLNI